VQKAVALGLDAVIVNPALVIGAGDLNRIAGDVLIRVAKRGIPIVVEGGLNLIHIDDVVRCHLAALERGKSGERYILGSENVTHVQYLGMAAAAAGVRAPSLILPTALVRSLRAPVTRINKVLSLPINGQMLEQAGYFIYFDVARAENELGLRERKPVRQPLPEPLIIAELLEQLRLILLHIHHHPLQHLIVLDTRRLLVRVLLRVLERRIRVTVQVGF
jgi:dihydroflavonol-4-reductase